MWFFSFDLAFSHLSKLNYWIQLECVRIHKKCSSMKATQSFWKWNRNPTYIIFVVSLVRSVSEVYKTHTGVITAVTAEGHASLTMTTLHLSIMQMHTRVATVNAAVALMRPRRLTSWHWCWMHKCLLHSYEWWGSLL